MNEDEKRALRNKAYFQGYVTGKTGRAKRDVSTLVPGSDVAGAYRRGLHDGCAKKRAAFEKDPHGVVRS